jgi:hypothetical protein
MYVVTGRRDLSSDEGAQHPPTELARTALGIIFVTMMLTT